MSYQKICFTALSGMKEKKLRELMPMVAIDNQKWELLPSIVKLFIDIERDGGCFNYNLFVVCVGKQQEQQREQQTG